MTSSVNWFLACDPQRFDGLVISYFNGQAAPTLAQRDGWTVDGVEFKVTLDVAAAPADYRGLYMNYGSLVFSPGWPWFYPVSPASRLP